jgi:Mn-dependent DtxR family transcriptional regulator
MKIYESGENYLETIYMLRRSRGYVRAVDISNELGYSKPTVSVAMKKFREEGYITVDGDGHIELTDKGQEIAEKIFERHNCLGEMLMYMGVDKETAYEDACRIEHYISDKSFRCLQKFFQENVKKG